MFLVIWSSVDPYRSSLVVVDELRLLGEYTCTSDHLKIWASIELLFLGFNLFWGIFVIYETWTFQKKAVMLETKWVLIALYDITLNAAILIPLLATLPTSDDTISLAFVISIDFSATGIILAVLGPSTWHALRDSSKSSDATPEALRNSKGKSLERSGSERIEVVGVGGRKHERALSGSRRLEEREMSQTELVSSSTHSTPQLPSSNLKDRFREIQSLINPRPLTAAAIVVMGMGGEDPLSSSISIGRMEVGSDLRLPTESPIIYPHTRSHSPEPVTPIPEVPEPEEPLEWSRNPVSTNE